MIELTQIYSQMVGEYNNFLKNLGVFSMQNQIRIQHSCSICLGVFYKPVELSKCKHRFCRECIDEACEEMSPKKCPLCRGRFRANEIQQLDKLWEELQSMYPDEIKQRESSIPKILKYRLKIGNTTNVLNVSNANKYEWKLFVEPGQGEAPLSKYIENVEIQLHPTFNPSIIMIPATEPVTLRRFGWGTFSIGVKIHWKKKYGGFTQFEHYLRFQPKVQKQVTCRLQEKKIS